MKSLVVLRVFFVMLALVGGTISVRAEDLNAVKARIEQRVGTVNSLKDQGFIGENNRGFLEARGNPNAGAQQVISQENADRRTVYAAIAAQTGANADAVGRQRAQQLASLARAGHWIQDTNGTWKKKA